MIVINRHGQKEEIKFDKVLDRVKGLSTGLSVDPAVLTQKVIAGVYDGIKTEQIDSLLSGTAAVMALDNFDYGILASRIAISSLHKETSESFTEVMSDLYKEGYLSGVFIKDVQALGSEYLNTIIDYEKDYLFDYFGFKTLEKSYLLKLHGYPVERPQHLFLRVSIGIYGQDKENIKKLYNYMSEGFYTHATPTLFNAGTKHSQLSSCFLVAMQDDSIEGIYDTKKDCALISKSAGGIGIHIHNIRATGTAIKGTNGTSNGIVPMLKTFESDMWYVDQGGGKRKGSMAVYLEPWHADVEDFLLLRRKKATNYEKVESEKVERRRTHDLNLALWIPDLFMKRLEEDKEWSLFCPTKAGILADLHGKEFEKKYEELEASGVATKKIKTRDLWNMILESQADNGEPYILFKDHCNNKSNQKNLGTIKSSNLCAEVVEYSDKDQTAVCNLASICLPKFVSVKNGNTVFDYDKLGEVVKFAVRSLNKVIDKNYYPTTRTKKSNDLHRPIALGIQGLNDVFMMFKAGFDSELAASLNKKIFSTMYYYAVLSSMDLAKTEGAYSTFKGSPASLGLLQFDLWGIKPETSVITNQMWNDLKEEVKQKGLRNSLLIALMPTASTSNIFGNFESFDPIQSNVFKRNVLSGEFPIINKHLVKILKELNLYNRSILQKIIVNDGSIQRIDEIPEAVKAIFKTAFEISMRTVIDLAADRGAYVCQSQSMNLFYDKPNFGKFSSALMHAWKKGLKTGSYYIRTKPAIQAQKITIDYDVMVKQKEAVACSLTNPETCEVCSS